MKAAVFHGPNQPLSIEDVEVEAASSTYRIRLRLKQGAAVDFYSADDSRAQRVKRLVEKSKKRNQPPEPTR